VSRDRLHHLITDVQAGNREHYLLFRISSHSAWDTTVPSERIWYISQFSTTHFRRVYPID